MSTEPKRRGRPRKEKPALGLPDALEAAQEAARLAQEGSLKLSRAVDILRQGLETLVSAEIDRVSGLSVTASELRMLAVQTLDAYSALSGQSWRRHKLTGPSRAGDRNLLNLEGLD
jgi:hypothetical protein